MDLHTTSSATSSSANVFVYTVADTYYYNGIIFDFREQRHSIRKCYTNYEFFQHMSDVKVLNYKLRTVV